MLTSFRIDRELSWATYYWHVGDLAEAMRRARAAAALNSTHATARLVMSMLYIDMGQLEAAVREAETAAQLTRNASGYLTHLGRAYALAGRTAEAQAVLDTLMTRGQKQYVGKDQIALVHLSLGDTATALDWLEQAVEDYHWWMPNSNYHPLWKAIHQHPRFDAMMRKIGAR